MTEIRQARFDEKDLLTDLTLESKSYWGYSKDFLENCRPHLTMTENYIESWPVKVLERNGEILAYFSLKTISGENRLDNLWIKSNYIRTGIGNLLFSQAVKEAKELGWTSFRLVGEEKAIGFYEKQGAKLIGEIESRLGKDIFLPHMEYNFDNLLLDTDPAAKTGVMTKKQLLERLSEKILSFEEGKPLLIAVDGVDGAGKSCFSKELFDQISMKTERKVLLSSTDFFHNQRSERYIKGKPIFQSFYENSFNYSAIKTKLLEPLSLNTEGDVFLKHFDHTVDTEVESPPVSFDENTILIFEGIFSHRPELINYWDLSIFLDCDFSETYKRMGMRDGSDSNPEDISNERYYKGQLLYLKKVNPQGLASIVINNSDYKRPIIVLEK